VKSPELFSAGYLVQVLGSLLLVFCCILGMLYLMRRFSRGGSGNSTRLAVLASASVGSRERVVLLRAGEEQILLGVAPGSVRTLHVFAEPVIVEAASTPQRPDFATILNSVNPLGPRK